MNEVAKFMFLNISTWVMWFFIVGFCVSKLSDNFLAKDRIFTKLFDFEKETIWFNHYLKIDKWKDKVPELGNFFGKGFPKRSVGQAEVSHLQLFIRETRRAEIAHWIMTAGWIFTIIFNPLWAIVFNLFFAHVVNFPCLLIQRYNRVRLLRVLETKLGSS